MIPGCLWDCLSRRYFPRNLQGLFSVSNHCDCRLHKPGTALCHPWCLCVPEPSLSLSQLTRKVSHFSPKIISVFHCSSIALLATMYIQRKEMEDIRIVKKELSGTAKRSVCTWSPCSLHLRTILSPSFGFLLLQDHPWSVLCAFSSRPGKTK